jgi:hypothetical protein
VSPADPIGMALAGPVSWSSSSLVIRATALGSVSKLVTAHVGRAVVAVR